MQDPNGNPDIFVDADDLVPQVNPADIPSAPPEGITDPEAINKSAIDKGANHVFTSTLEATGEAERERGSASDSQGNFGWYSAPVASSQPTTNGRN